LRTSDGRSAESLSKLAGDVELLHFRETHSHGPRVRGRNASFSTETVREPRVLPSQIAPLQNLEGFLFQPGVVVPFHMHRLPVFQRAPRLIAYGLKTGSGRKQTRHVEFQLEAQMGNLTTSSGLFNG
jgi:hypothetical protein